MSAVRGVGQKRREGEMSKRSGGGFLKFIGEFIAVVAVALVMAWLLTSYVVQPYEIPSGSMEDTIEIGDRVLSEKVTSHASDPQQGDIVTFLAYEDPANGDIYTHESDADATVQERLEEKVLIKRVIATAGQTVDIADGAVYVDGEQLVESYTDGAVTTELEGSDIEFPYTVAEGELWVMGDNRTNSKDSRFFGGVPVQSVTGRAVFCYWPTDRIGLLE